MAKGFLPLPFFSL
uniref:Uncharacterized protein n=1 Tax=Arundo donax TaxID=35708 RepID=A0A0A9DPU1_ARUDO